MGANQSQIDQLVDNETLQKNVTNVMINTSNTNTNSVSVNQSNQITFGDGVDFSKCDFLLQNTANVNVTYLSKIDSQTVVDMKSALKSDIENTVKQTVKIIRELGGSIATDNDDNISQTIKNRITQIIEKNVSVKKVNTIMNGTFTIQNNALVLGKNSKCVDSKFTLSNDLVMKMVATNVISDIVKIANDDDSMIRIKNDVTQDATIKADGFAGLLRALTGPLIAIVIAGIAAFTVLGKQGLQSVTDPKFMLIFGGVFVAYIVVAYFVKIFPFKKKRAGAPSDLPQPWVCQQHTSGPSKGYNTGQCSKWIGSAPPPTGVRTFDTQSECNAQSSTACPMYWGCEKDPSKDELSWFTGKCTQYDNALDGPYPDRSRCDDDIISKKACRYYWGCGDGIDKPLTGSCYQYQNLADGPQISMQSCQSTGGCITAA